jgi:hypothetical protein
MLLAHLVRQRSEEDDEDETDDENYGTGEDRRLARILIAGGMLRRSRMRRLLLTYLLRDRR